MDLGYLQYTKKQIFAGTRGCFHDFAIANFCVHWQKEDIKYCLTCQKLLSNFKEEWSTATLIHIYNVDTEEQISPYLEKLEERLNNLCESNPEMKWGPAAYMLYCSTFDEEVKRQLEKK